MMRSKRFVRRFLTPGAALLPALLLATCGGTSPTAPIEGCEGTLGQQVLDLVNQERAQQGLAPLQLDLRLAAAAQGHSDDMAAGNFMSHTGSNGSSPRDRIEATGYPWVQLAENVAAGQPTPEAVMSAWMGSSGHRANILRGSSQHIGIGYRFGEGTRYGHYWTMNFGATGDAADTAPACHP